MQQANGQVTWPKRNHLINPLYSGTPLNDTFANSENPYEMPKKIIRVSTFAGIKRSSATKIHHNLEIPSCDPLKYIMDDPILTAFNCMGKSIR